MESSYYGQPKVKKLQQIQCYSSAGGCYGGQYGGERQLQVDQVGAFGYYGGHMETNSPKLTKLELVVTMEANNSKLTKLELVSIV